LARNTRSIEESALLVGMVGLVQFLPLFCLSLFAGSVADRLDRRKIVLVTMAAEALGVLALFGVSLHPTPNITAIFAIAAVFGATRAFLSPASSALTPMLVPKSDMPRAIALKSLGWQVTVIVGPWIGGMLVAASTAAAYGVAAGLYGLGIFVVAFMRGNMKPQAQPGSRMEQIREGLVYVWTNKIIFGAISLDLFAVLLGGATALLPAFASDILKVGPDGFGLLRSGPAIGAALMALALNRWPLARMAGRRMFLSVAVFGAATLLFAVSKSMPLSIFALAILGAADMVSMYVRQTLVQIVTPDHMRGRVSSVSGLFISGSNELGEFESGVVARVLGPVGAAVFGGIGTLIVTGAWARMFPALYNADRLDGTEPVGEEIEPISLTAPAS
jgi:MFS family permease